MPVKTTVRIITVTIGIVDNTTKELLSTELQIALEQCDRTDPTKMYIIDTKGALIARAPFGIYLTII